MIYHITDKEQWQHAIKLGYYEAPSLQSEGFIHLSKKDQVQDVLERYYKKQQNLLLLHIDESKLKAPLKYEIAPSINAEFPHLFGRLNIEAVIEIIEIE